MNTAVHPGGLNATQSLAFFRANGIKGKPLRRMRGGRVLAEYQCRAVYLGGLVLPYTARILAPIEAHNLEQA